MTKRSLGRKRFLWLTHPHPNHSLLSREAKAETPAWQEYGCRNWRRDRGGCCWQACSLWLVQPTFFHIPRPSADGSIDKPPTSINNKENSLQMCPLADLREALSHCNPLFPDYSWFCHIDNNNKKLSVLQVKEYQKSEGEETEKDVMMCWRNSRKLGICFM